MITCSKKYKEFPFAHRQHSHDGHCALIHGHNWDFKFTFRCVELDDNGFVVDFGKLKDLKNWLTALFDHTLVLNEGDPLLSFFKTQLSEPKLAAIVVVPNCGAEGLAKWLLEQVNLTFFFKDNIRHGKRFVEVCKVTVYEDSRNSATFSIQA